MLQVLQGSQQQGETFVRHVAQSRELVQARPGASQCGKWLFAWYDLGEGQ